MAGQGVVAVRTRRDVGKDGCSSEVFLWVSWRDGGVFLFLPFPLVSTLNFGPIYIFFAAGFFLVYHFIVLIL